MRRRAVRKAPNRYGPDQSVIHRSGHAWQKIRLKVLQRDRFQCVICGSTEKLEIDHIVERRYGGSDALVNLRCCCHACHVRKTAALNDRRKR